MTGRRKNQILMMTGGAIIVLYGVLLLLGDVIPFFDIDPKLFWPSFFFAPVILFIVTFALNGKSAKWTIFPIVICAYLGILFLWLNYNPMGWEKLSGTWPHFIMMVGLSFFFFYLFDLRWPLLIPTGILILTSTVFFMIFSQRILLLSIIIIILGVSLIVRMALDKTPYDDEWD